MPVTRAAGGSSSGGFCRSEVCRGPHSRSCLERVASEHARAIFPPPQGPLDATGRSDTDLDCELTLTDGAPSFLQNAGALQSGAEGAPRACPRASITRHRVARPGVLLQRRSGPRSHRPRARDPDLAVERDLRTGELRGAQPFGAAEERANGDSGGGPSELRGGAHPRGRPPDDVHHGLVHQRGLRLPVVRDRRDPAHRALSSLPAPLVHGALGRPGQRLPRRSARPDDGMPVPRAAHELRIGRPTGAGSCGAGVGRRACGARADQRRDGPRVRRVGPRLLHAALRRADRPRPDGRRVLRHRAVEQRALAALVLQGTARHRRRGASREPHGAAPGAARRES